MNNMESESPEIQADKVIKEVGAEKFETDDKEPVKQTDDGTSKLSLSSASGSAGKVETRVKTVSKTSVKKSKVSLTVPAKKETVQKKPKSPPLSGNSHYVTAPTKSELEWILKTPVPKKTDTKESKPATSKKELDKAKKKKKGSKSGSPKSKDGKSKKQPKQAKSPTPDAVINLPKTVEKKVPAAKKTDEEIYGIVSEIGVDDNIPKQNSQESLAPQKISPKSSEESIPHPPSLIVVQEPLEHAVQEVVQQQPIPPPPPPPIPHSGDPPAPGVMPLLPKHAVKRASFPQNRDPQESPYALLSEIEAENSHIEQIVVDGQVIEERLVRPQTVSAKTDDNSHQTVVPRQSNNLGSKSAQALSIHDVASSSGSPRGLPTPTPYKEYEQDPEGIFEEEEIESQNERLSDRGLVNPKHQIPIPIPVAIPNGGISQDKLYRAPSSSDHPKQQLNIPVQVKSTTNAAKSPTSGPAQNQTTIQRKLPTVPKSTASPTNSVKSVSDNKKPATNIAAANTKAQSGSQGIKYDELQYNSPPITKSEKARFARSPNTGLLLVDQPPKSQKSRSSTPSPKPVTDDDNEYEVIEILEEVDSIREAEDHFQRLTAEQEEQSFREQKKKPARQSRPQKEQSVSPRPVFKPTQSRSRDQIFEDIRSPPTRVTSNDNIVQQEEDQSLPYLFDESPPRAGPPVHYHGDDEECDCDTPSAWEDAAELDKMEWKRSVLPPEALQAMDQISGRGAAAERTERVVVAASRDTGSQKAKSPGIGKTVRHAAPTSSPREGDPSKSAAPKKPAKSPKASNSAKKTKSKEDVKAKAKKDQDADLKKSLEKLVKDLVKEAQAAKDVKQPAEPTQPGVPLFVVPENQFIIRTTQQPAEVKNDNKVPNEAPPREDMLDQKLLQQMGVGPPVLPPGRENFRTPEPMFQPISPFREPELEKPGSPYPVAPPIPQFRNSADVRRPRGSSQQSILKPRNQRYNDLDNLAAQIKETDNANTKQPILSPSAGRPRAQPGFFRGTGPAEAPKSGPQAELRLPPKDIPEVRSPGFPPPPTSPELRGYHRRSDSWSRDGAPPFRDFRPVSPQIGSPNPRDNREHRSESPVFPPPPPRPNRSESPVFPTPHVFHSSSSGRPEKSLEKPSSPKPPPSPQPLEKDSNSDERSAPRKKLDWHKAPSKPKRTSGKGTKVAKKKPVPNKDDSDDDEDDIKFKPKKSKSSSNAKKGKK